MSPSPINHDVFDRPTDVPPFEYSPASREPLRFLWCPGKPGRGIIHSGLSTATITPRARKHIPAPRQPERGVSTRGAMSSWGAPGAYGLPTTGTFLQKLGGALPGASAGAAGGWPDRSSPASRKPGRTPSTRTAPSSSPPRSRGCGWRNIEGHRRALGRGTGDGTRRGPGLGSRQGFPRVRHGNRGIDHPHVARRGTRCSSHDPSS
jgi:hypothetical protein